MRLRALLLAGCCIAAAGSAHAGLLSDDEARKQIQQLEARTSKLEESQGRSLIDLQTQIDTLNADLRKLRGQNEELAHGLQDAEKRQKDFYIDLDTRLRRFEAVDNSAPAPQSAAAAASGVPAAGTEAQQDAAPVYDPAVEDRAYEAAYAFFRAASYQNAINGFQEFLKNFPDSIFVPNVHYWLGESYFAQQDYKNALTSYQQLVTHYAYSPNTPDAMLGTANCQQALKSVAGAKKTLKQLIAKYPASEAAGKAKKLLATLK
ncbi:MAG: tol-pal system protein YbgF [Sideroxydans sp.]|nr:tol-pal system protein YbgF [Sideroxydans sp.]